MWRSVDVFASFLLFLEFEGLVAITTFVAVELQVCFVVQTTTTAQSPIIGQRRILCESSFSCWTLPEVWHFMTSSGQDVLPFILYTQSNNKANERPLGITHPTA